MEFETLDPREKLRGFELAPCAHDYDKSQLPGNFGQLICRYCGEPNPGTEIVYPVFDLGGWRRISNEPHEVFATIEKLGEAPRCRSLKLDSTQITETTLAYL